jgi:hypothetical protein
MHKLPVMASFAVGRFLSSDFIQRELKANEEEFKNWLNNLSTPNKRSDLFRELKEPVHVAWYLLNAKTSQELKDAFYCKGDRKYNLDDASIFDLINFRVLDTFIPLLMLHQNNPRQMLEQLNQTASALDDAIESLRRRTIQQPDFVLNHQVSEQIILLLRSITQSESSDLLLSAITPNNPDFVSFVHALLPRVESGFNRRNNLVILLSTLVASALALRLVYTGDESQESFDHLTDNFLSLLNAFNVQPEGIQQDLRDAVNKYRCIQESLLNRPISNPKLIFGSVWNDENVNYRMNYHFGFSVEPFGTYHIERAFDVSAYQIADLFQEGVSENYIANYAYRTESKHWAYAIEALKEDQSKKNLQKLVHLQHHTESPELAKEACRKLFSSTNFGTSDQAESLYLRCTKDFPELLDDLYLIGANYPRPNTRVIKCLRNIGPPSDAILSKLPIEFRKLKLEIDMGMDI